MEGISERKENRDRVRESGNKQRKRVEIKRVEDGRNTDKERARERERESRGKVRGKYERERERIKRSDRERDCAKPKNLR